MDNVTGWIITIYNEYVKNNPIENVDINSLVFEPIRFPKHQYRYTRLGNCGIAWTTELNPPEIGADSSMELGLEI